MTGNWMELAIITFIVVGIGVTVWKGGAANPETTGSLGRRMGRMEADLRALKVEFTAMDKRLSDPMHEIHRLEQALGTLESDVTHMREQMAAIVADSAHTRKQVDRLYDFIVERGMSK